MLSGGDVPISAGERIVVLSTGLRRKGGKDGERSGDELTVHSNAACHRRGVAYRHGMPTRDVTELARAAYFERCWLGAGKVRIRSIEKLFAQGDQAFVLYVAEGADGIRFQNVELVTARDGKVRSVEVYFGWNLRPASS